MRIATVLRKVSWRDLGTTVAPFAFAFVIAVLITLHYLQPAPPTTLTLTSGPDGSAFRRAATASSSEFCHPRALRTT
jgi:hypothetical protein